MRDLVPGYSVANLFPRVHPLSPLQESTGLTIGPTAFDELDDFLGYLSFDMSSGLGVSRLVKIDHSVEPNVARVALVCYDKNENKRVVADKCDQKVNQPVSQNIQRLINNQHQLHLHSTYAFLCQTIHHLQWVEL